MKISSKSKFGTNGSNGSQCAIRDSLIKVTHTHTHKKVFQVLYSDHPFQNIKKSCISIQDHQHKTYNCSPPPHLYRPWLKKNEKVLNLGKVPDAFSQSESSDGWDRGGKKEIKQREECQREQ